MNWKIKTVALIAIIKFLYGLARLVLIGMGCILRTSVQIAGLKHAIMCPTLTIVCQKNSHGLASLTGL
jgi:hypothetical protein